MIYVSSDLFLASSSKTRKALLASHGLNLKTFSPDLDEESIKKEFLGKISPAELAMKLAQAKGALASSEMPNAFFIAADQVCELDGEIFDKPLTRENAINHLSKLRNKTHIQNCATVIYHKNACIWQFNGQAYLTMRNLKDEEVESYIDLERPFHSAGSYMFEKHGKHLFSEVIGDHDVILGLPIVKLVNQLYELALVGLLPKIEASASK